MFYHIPGGTVWWWLLHLLLMIHCFLHLPWNGFTLDWFFSSDSERLGVIQSDSAMLESIGISAFVAFLGNSVIFVCGPVQLRFCIRALRFSGFKEFFYMLMLLPLVIPGVILRHIYTHSV